MPTIPEDVVPAPSTGWLGCAAGGRIQPFSSRRPACLVMKWTARRCGWNFKHSRQVRS